MNKLPYLYKTTLLVVCFIATFAALIIWEFNLEKQHDQALIEKVKQEIKEEDNARSNI